MIIKACQFKRTETSIWEKGITFEGNNEIPPIIDMNAQIVELPVYDINDLYYDLCIDLKGITTM